LLLGVMLASAAATVQAAGERTAPGASAQQSRSDARGWLQLDLDQRAYRERVEPLDLQQQRRLEVIEREQRLDLRALQQRDARELEQAARQRRLAPDHDLGVAIPRRDAAADIRRRAERHRDNIRREQLWLPFSRR
jgi:hypothetical protein